MTEHFADHVTRGVERLIERYRLPRTSALLASWLTEVQAVEDAFYELLTERSIAVATGDMLDILGRIVGQPRDGRDDDTYRLWIAARMMVQRSSGTTEQIIAIVDKLTGGGLVKLREYYPASFVVTTEAEITASDGIQIGQLVALAKPAGVRCYFVWPSAFTTAFRFAPTPDVSVFDSPEGFDRGAFAYVSDGTPVPPPEGEVTYAGEVVTDGGVPVFV